MKVTLWKLLPVVTLLFVVPPFGYAQGTVTQVKTRTVLGATDFLDWSTLGSAGTVLTSPVTATTSAGISVTAANQYGFQILTENGVNNWGGNFALGDYLLINPPRSTSPITLSFGTPISGVGFQIEGNGAGIPFAGQMTAFNGSTNLGTYTVNGVEAATGDNSAVFLGISDTVPEITSIVISTTQPDAYSGSFAINRLSISTNSSLSAPTNLQATQIRTDGTQIQLTWDYGTDPTDGFKIKYQRPSGAIGYVFSGPNDCTTVNTGLHCRTTVGGLPSFASFTYQVLAFHGTEESAYSDPATGYQLSINGELCLSLNDIVTCSGLMPLLGSDSTLNNSIKVIFEPDTAATLDEAAHFFGFDHFNWISVVNHDDTATTWCSASQCPLITPYLDPPVGGYTRPLSQPFDSLSYYWNEENGFDSRYFVTSNQTPTSASFYDHPWDTGRLSNGYIGFFTSLVGVTSPIGNQPPRYTPLASFGWFSTTNSFNGTGLGRHSNLDPAGGAESGGIFSVRLVNINDLPLDVRSLLIQSGALGVTSGPKVDRDAPTTTAFLSGPQGLNGWYTGPVTVTLIATDIDGPSDIAATSYTVDVAFLTAYAGPFTISGDGIHTLEYGSVDRVGNAETPRPTQQIKIDGTAPSIAVTATASRPREEDEKIVRIAISGTITDLTSGVNPASATFVVRNEHGIRQTGGPVTVAADGKYSFGISFEPTRRHGGEQKKYEIAVSAKDNAGNQGSSSASVSLHRGRRDRDDEAHSDSLEDDKRGH